MIEVFEKLEGGSPVLYVMGWPTLMPVKMVERPDWVKLGMDRDIGLAEIKQAYNTLVADIAARQVPVLLPWHSGLVPKADDPNNEREKDGEIPPPQIGEVFGCDLMEAPPALLTHWRVTHPAAIAAIKAGSMKKWSPEFMPRPPYRLFAIASTQGGRAHFGRLLPDLYLPPKGTLLAASEYFKKAIDTQQVACAILCASELLPQLIGPQGDETMPLTQAEHEKLVNDTAAKVAELLEPKIAKASEGKGESLSKADVETIVTEAVAKASAKPAITEEQVNAKIAAAERGFKVKGYAKEIVNLGSPLKLEDAEKQLGECKTDKELEIQYRAMASEAREYKLKNAPARHDPALPTSDAELRKKDESDVRAMIAKGSLKIAKGTEEQVVKDFVENRASVRARYEHVRG